MSAKEYLEQVVGIEKEMEYYEEKYNELLQKATSIGSIDTAKEFVDSSSDSPDAAFTHAIDAAMEYRDKIYKLWDAKIALSMEVHETIEKLSDPRERTVLLRRYLEYPQWTWERIAEELYYAEYKSVTALHGRALQHLDEVLKSNT